MTRSTPRNTGGPQGADRAPEAIAHGDQAFALQRQRDLLGKEGIASGKGGDPAREFLLWRNLAKSARNEFANSAVVKLFEFEDAVAPGRLLCLGPGFACRLDPSSQLLQILRHLFGAHAEHEQQRRHRTEHPFDQPPGGGIQPLAVFEYEGERPWRQDAEDIAEEAHGRIGAVGTFQVARSLVLLDLDRQQVVKKGQAVCDPRRRADARGNAFEQDEAIAFGGQSQKRFKNASPGQKRASPVVPFGERHGNRHSRGVKIVGKGGSQPALADAGFAQDDDKTARTAARLLESMLQESEFPLSANQRCRRQGPRLRLKRPKDRRHVAKSRQLDGSALLEIEGRPACPFGRRIAQHIIGDGRDEARGAIDRRAENHQLSAARAADDSKQGFARRHADRDGKPHLRDMATDGAGGIHGAGRVVAVKRPACPESAEVNEPLVVEEEFARRTAVAVRNRLKRCAEVLVSDERLGILV